MSGTLLTGALGAGLLLALLLASIWAAQRMFPAERRSETGVARATLRRRYAAGELPQAEYLRALRALGRDDRDDRLLV